LLILAQINAVDVYPINHTWYTYVKATKNIY